MTTAKPLPETNQGASWRVLLELGRVSNLPTVWSNVLAGAVLSGARIGPLSYVYVCFALSCLYTGGMFLNDAFDRRYDGEVRPERPIPSGRIRAANVFFLGFAQLLVGIVLVLLTRLLGTGPGATAGSGAVPSVIALACLIVLYDWRHKGNPLGPSLMALCRVGVYTTSYFVFAAEANRALALGALFLFLYVAMLTYAARRENLGRALSWLQPALPPPSVGTLVGWLIAGIALVDALVIACAGELLLAILAAGAFGLTLRWQRSVAGT